jgi:uroporphyrinogen III methyltransferase/synthase
VGAGPGDPGLITCRGLEILRTADVIVYDRLAPSELLLEARPEARLHYVGKSAGRHALKQEDINALLAEAALAGHSVCRLKGGDPFLFGRGGEEADYLRQRGVIFEVVPGVTSALAAPAYAGIPVTDRRHASLVSIATGHAQAGEQSPDWRSLAGQRGTLVVLMGMSNLAKLVQELLAGGRAADTPAAVVHWGATNRQVAVYSDLSHIAGEVVRQGIGAPAVLVVGEAVALGERLAWFRPGPLRGLRVLVTRPRHQASSFARQLRQAGAEPVVCSVIRTEPIAVSSERLRECLARPWHWVLFTSANGVTAFRDCLLAAQLDWRALAGARLAAIGPGTAAELTRAGLRVDFTPSRAVADSLAAELPSVAAGTDILLPRAAEARDALPEGLRARGASVEVLRVYRTLPDSAGLALLRAALEEGVDVVTFTSSSGVRALLGAVAKAALRGIAVASIGPITSEAARASGLRVAIEATEHTIPGLVAAIEDYASRRPQRERPSEGGDADA